MEVQLSYLHLFSHFPTLEDFVVKLYNIGASCVLEIEESERLEITKVIWIHPLNAMNIYHKYHGNPFRDVLFWTEEIARASGRHCYAGGASRKTSGIKVGEKLSS